MMKINEQNASLLCVCGNTKQFPKESLPEIAFAGKSNVGKSSLINLLLNRKSLARTSSVPGKTQTINWYGVDGKLYLVDLPGYGYAKAAKTDQSHWSSVIEAYLHTRRTLKGVLLLVDIRHEPGANDVMMMDWLRHYHIKTVIAATKADKITRNQTVGQIKHIAETLGVKKEDVIPVSALTKSGRDAIWGRLLTLMAAEEAEESKELAEKTALPVAPEGEA